MVVFYNLISAYIVPTQCSVLSQNVSKKIATLTMD